jgi:hypothetical protein
MYVIHTRIGRYAFLICPLPGRNGKFKKIMVYAVSLLGHVPSSLSSDVDNMGTTETVDEMLRTSVAIKGSRDESVPQGIKELAHCAQLFLKSNF